MKKLGFWLLASMLFIASCEKDDDAPTPPPPPAEKPEATYTNDTVFTLSAVTEVFEFPVSIVPNSFAIQNDKLYVLDDSITYSLDLKTSQWDTANINNSGLYPGNFGHPRGNFSILKGSDWYYFCPAQLMESILFKFNFDSQEWIVEQVFPMSTYGMRNPVQIYENGKLFIIDMGNNEFNTKKIYEYDFASKELISKGDHSFENSGDQVSEIFHTYNGKNYWIVSTFKYTNDDRYMAPLVQILEFDSQTYTFSLVSEFEPDGEVGGGISLMHENKAIFGMGQLGFTEGKPSNINKKLYYYDFDKNEFDTVRNEIQNPSMYSHAFTYNGAHYVFGGYTNDKNPKTTLDKFSFETIIEKVPMEEE